MSIKDNIFRSGLDVAVIGMAGRFPGARNIDEFFNNLKNGVESINFLTRQELEELGVPAELINDAGFVNAKAGLENVSYFDASFFGYTAGEAALMDPQMRLFHECAWEAMENAGTNPELYQGSIGVYAGGTPNAFWEALTLFGETGGLSDSIISGAITETFGKTLFNDKDLMSTWISYKFDLRGPSNTMFSSCSTSLVVIHTACQAILSGECDMALAGGVSVMTPERNGYLYQEGLIVSADGHCRAFDAEASGTVFGDGVGIVVLKLLEKALEDNDTIYAVVKSTAVNNDGGRKVGFTAPSVEGQEEVIRMAHQLAEIKPHQVGYVEAHGTGTIIGDPIEFEALRRAFGPGKQLSCALGSVKTNVGHLNSAAGVCGFIKTVLSLYHKYLFPSLNFKKPNPGIDLENSPFYINTELKKWENLQEPLIAGVSSFGVGGTNAHVILCEAPYKKPDASPLTSRGYQLILFSAKSKTALQKMYTNLALHLKNNPLVNLADVSYTLQVGRKTFPHRKMVLASNINNAVEILSSTSSEKFHTIMTVKNGKPLVYMFPGQGAQYFNMGLGLYETEPLFQEQIDQCFKILNPIMGNDIKEVLYSSENKSEQNAECTDKINQTEFAQPLLFIFEYALAKLLMSWGIMPCAMIGHSIGEYVAACLAGIFSLEDALAIVAFRGKLMQQLPGGAMVSISLPEKHLVPLLTEKISLAAINSPESCVVSGANEDMDVLLSRLEEEGQTYRRLHTSHAFHSLMMEPILNEFTRKIEGIKLNKPSIPFISNISGLPITIEECTDPRYWARHLRETVRFSAGLQTLLKQDCFFVEIGPGKTLTSFVNQHKKNNNEKLVVNLVKHPKEDVSDDYYLLSKIGELWLYGVAIDWRQFYPGERRTRIPLPPYPFEGKKYWYDLKKLGKETSIQVKIEASERLDSMNDKSELNAGSSLPANKIEQKLVDSWEKFFGINGISIDDDFFELGGDSLKSSIIISRIHKEFNVKIPIAEFFKRPTIRGLALFIADNNRKDIHFSIEPVEKKEYYELSSAQKRLYILYEMDRQAVGYNMPYFLVLEGEFDKEKLEHTFRRLIRRHESLRTSFQMINDEPVQQIHDNVKFEIEYKDLATEGTEVEKRKRRREEDEKIGIEDFVRSFDLTEAPLLRVRLVKEKKDRHILMVDMHHIISDGTSMNILVKDSMDMYQGEGLSELRLHYKDFSVWQNSEKQKESIRGQEYFWLNEFAGEIPVLELPADYPRPAFQSFEGNQITFEMDNESTVILKALTLKSGTTLYMLLLALYTVFLSKLTGQEEIITGSPIAGRRHTDLTEIIGMFVNTLVMRNYPSGEKPFALFLKEVKEKTLKAFENQDYQYEVLVEKVVLTKDTSRNPLFDTMFDLQNIEIAEINISGLKLSPYPYENKTAKFDLSLTMVEAKEKLLFNFEYNTKLFKEETANRFITYFKNVVNSALENKDRRISDIEVITEEEKKQILVNFNSTETEYPKDKTIHQLFVEQALKTPDHIALVGPVGLVGQVGLSYKKLNDQSERLAGLLIEKGILPDSIVGIMMERSIEMIIGIMSILKSGGAYLPIDPEYPQERIDYMLKDSNAKLTINYEFLKDAPQAPFLQHSIFHAFDIPRIQHSDTHHLAYIIYTSGSTGKPKGVMVEHKNLVHYVYAFAHEFMVNAWDTVLQQASYCFDVFAEEVYPVLLAGGRIAIPTKNQVIDINLLSLFILKNKITIVDCSPLLLNELDKNAPFMMLRNIRIFISGGDVLKGAYVTSLIKNRTVYNTYGPTESTICTTYYKCHDVGMSNVPIGKPIADYFVLILSENGHLVPIGVAGELCVAGPGVTRGYLNNPELTVKKFIKNRSYRSYKTYILYKTGDLTRWLSDGNIEFLGRIDKQVKIRGFRIELGEIEKYLLAYDNIKEAVVIARSDREEKYLCAYIAPISQKKINTELLRNHLSSQLPDYMIPAYIVQLDEIPLTPNGKINRQKLPAPIIQKGETFNAPKGEDEKTMVGIWSEILHLDRETIGIDSNFFELGGDSLQLIRLNNRLREFYQREIPMVAMFRYTTVRSLVNYLKPGATGEVRVEGNLPEVENNRQDLNEVEDLLKGSLQLFEEVS